MFAVLHGATARGVALALGGIAIDAADARVDFVGEWGASVAVGGEAV